VLTDDALRAEYLKQLERGSGLPPPPVMSANEPAKPPQEPAAPAGPRPAAPVEPARAAGPPKLAQDKKPAKAKEGPADRALKAEALFTQAKAAMARKRHSFAKTLLEQIIKLCPDEAEYRAELGLAMFRSEPGNTTVVRVARDELNQAVSLSPMLDKPHLYLGWIYRQMGQRAMSVHEFEQALMCNPKCAEAVRELRLLRNRARSKKKGIGKLLGKWKRG